MTVETPQQRWARIKAILAEVLEQGAENRAVVVNKYCADDAPLRAEIERLLALNDSETISLEQAPFISNLEERRAARLVSGETIGTWTLERELGQGGMGSVWLAQRTDASFHQMAAIKVVRGIASATLLTRLRIERQALAALSHPNIAHLIDGGETTAGVPYIAMEYIDGLPVDVWCQSRQLDLRSRLQLMMQLVRAVAYAHEHLLVHRDIKPSNVLVTSDGQVKLLDFGVVKLLAPDGDTRAATEFSERALTPEYASPEQVQGKPITVAADVYGLGATLYRVLTGVTPFGDVKRDPFALLKAVVEQPPTRASVTVRQNESESPVHEHAQSQALRGDIDTILMKALAKNPGERYPTALDLGRDLQAHLDGYPIAARPPTWHYVTRKFVARNRLASAALAGALLSLVVGLGAALHQASRATAQRNLAQREEARATAALDVAQQERARSAAALAAEQRERGAALAATAQAELQRSAALASAASALMAQRHAEAQRLLAASRFSEVRALANRVVSEYADDLLGTYGTTQTRLKIINDSVRFLDRLRKDANGDPGLLSELSRGYRKLAFALSGDASVRDHPRAAIQLALARQLRGQVVAARGLTKLDLAEMALLDEAEGDLARQQYQFAKAAPLLQRARSGFSRLRDWKFDDPWDRVGQARAALHAAFALIEPGTTGQTSGGALDLLDEAQAALDEILLSAPADPVARFHLSDVHLVRGLLLRQTGKFDAAEVQYDHSERLAGELANQYPNNAIYVQMWSRVLGDRKTIRISQGREQAGFADGIKRAELASMVRSREPGNPQAVLSDLVAWSGLCSDYLRLDKGIAVSQLPCQHALEGARAMLAMRQVDPFAAPAYQAMIVAGLAGIQVALQSGGDTTAVNASLRLQRDGLTGLTKLTPAVSEDPLRTAYLVNTRIAVGHGLEIAGRHADATRAHEESLALIEAISRVKIEEVYTPSLLMFIHRRMAHNFLLQSRKPDTPAAEQASLLAQSLISAQKYIEVAAAARASGRLSELFAGYLPEMQRFARGNR